MSGQQKIRIGIIAAGLAILVAIAAAVIVTVGGNTGAYEKHMELARQYLDELQYEQAIAEYKAAIEVEPSNQEAYLALADIYAQQGDYEAALAILNQGLEQTDAEEIKMQAGEVSKQYAAAQALQAEQARKEEQLAKEAEAERKKEEEERVREEAEKAKEAEYNQHMETAEQYIAEEDYEQAFKEYEAALELYSDRTDVYLAIAELYVMMEDFEMAIEVLNRGIKKTEDKTLEVKLEEFIKNAKHNISHYASGVISAIYEYDEDGNRLRELHYYVNGVTKKIVEYDGYGNLVKFIDYYETGAVQCISTEERTIQYWYYESGAISGIAEWEGMCLETYTSYYESGAIEFIEEGDGKGNWAKTTYYDENGNIVDDIVDKIIWDY